MKRIGIDLGGSAIKAGSVTTGGEILARSTSPAGHEQGPEQVVANIVGLVAELGGVPEAGIGVGAPGLLDRDQGVLLECPNLQSVAGFPFRASVAAALDLPEELVRLENDANVAALGEHWLGAARGVRDCAVITLGTGIGSGLVLEDRLYIGPGGLAAEMGHVVVAPGGLVCGCGTRGCVETLASATAARRRALEQGLPAVEPGNLELLAARARAGSEPEAKLLFDVGRDLGRGLAPSVVILDLRHFVIGGGFGAALDVLLPGIRKGITEHSLGREAASFTIVPAGLGADAGWIGAAKLSSSPPL